MITQVPRICTNLLTNSIKLARSCSCFLIVGQQSIFKLNMNKVFFSDLTFL